MAECGDGGAKGAWFTVCAQEAPASASECDRLRELYPCIPDEYYGIVATGTEIQCRSPRGQHLRIKGPSTVERLDQLWGVSAEIPGAAPIADDGGDMELFYWDGPCGFGVYRVDLGARAPDDAEWVARSLRDLIQDGYEEE